MKELTITNLHKTYGIKTLLAGIDFSIRTGDRVGLIGPNGTGKSSFLKVLAGLDNYDEGTIEKPNQYEIAYLDQHPDFDPEASVLETIYQSKAPAIQLVKNYELARLKLEGDPHNENYLKEFNLITDRMGLEGGWDVELKAKAILSQLKISNLSMKLRECSGGQRKRIGIAQVLIAEPDLLILDEPTNHLDVQSIQWLEKYLATYQGALFLVTHDRYFLERVVNKIVELRHGLFYVYEGNYQAYLTKKAEQVANEVKQARKQDRLYVQELAWMRQGAQARSTKQQARIDRFNALKDQLENRHTEANAISFDFNQQRLGNQVIEAEDISVSIGNKQVIKGFTKHFVNGDRMGIVGDNGVGKSTFLNTLAGFHPIDEGSLIKGSTIRLAYYRQLDEDLPNNERVLTYLNHVAETFKRPDGSQVTASQMLERFNFPKESHGAYIQSLSGGERRRLYLLTLLIQEPNVLFLDEPTNDLDIDTLTTLEDYLDSFEGVVIIVSHDRYFLDKTVDQILWLKGAGEFETHWTTYSEFLEQRASVKESKTQTTNPVEVSSLAESPQPAEKSKKQRMTYQEKQEWAKIEDQIAKCEAEIETIQSDMISKASDAGALMDLQERLDQREADLLELYERYEYLSELEN